MDFKNLNEIKDNHALNSLLKIMEFGRNDKNY